MYTTNTKTLSLISVAAAISIYCYYSYEILSRATISPEIGMAYMSLADVNGFKQIIYKFITFNEEWYRPLTFYLTNKILFNFIDITDLFKIKLVGVAMIGLVGLLNSVLSKAIYDSDLSERAFVFMLTISHPLYYIIAYDGSGITDALVNLLILLFTLIFMRFLIGGENQKNRCALGVICVIVALLCLTSQERAFAISFIMLSILVWKADYKLASLNQLLKISEVRIVFFVLSLLFITYLYFVYLGKPSWSGPDYRTSIETNYLLRNIVRAAELPFRFLIFQTNKSYDVHLNMQFNLCSVIFILSFLFYTYHVFFNLSAGSEKRKYFLIITLFISVLIIPVLFGGNVWHFYTASLFVSIVTARSLRSNFAKFKKCIFRTFFYLLTIFSIFQSINLGIRDELGVVGDGKSIMYIVTKALESPVLAQSKNRFSTIYFDTAGYGDNVWAFGGKANLFKYIYQDSELIEIPVNRGKIVSGYEGRCKSADLKKYINFKFNPKDLSWSITDDYNYCDKL